MAFDRKNIPALICCSVAAGFVVATGVTFDRLGYQRGKAEMLAQQAASQPKQGGVDDVGTDSSPSIENPKLSKAFVKKASDYPWMNDVQRSLGYLKGEAAESRIQTVAVLLDEKGTILFVAPVGAHLVKPPHLSFPAIGEDSVVPYNFHYDAKHDLMFASIDPAFIQKHGLKPVDWGSPFQRNMSDSVVIDWDDTADKNIMLQIDQGADTSSVGIFAAMDAPKIACTAQKNIALESGAIFSADGKFDGIVHIATDLDESGVGALYTPEFLLRAAYIGLYPDRAKKVGVVDQPVSPSWPDYCKFNKTDFHKLTPK